MDYHAIETKKYTVSSRNAYTHMSEWMIEKLNNAYEPRLREVSLYGVLLTSRPYVAGGLTMAIRREGIQYTKCSTDTGNNSMRGRGVD